MSDGIDLRILGDFGPFSRIGKSIGYQLYAGAASWLVDCGAPLFEQLGGQGLKSVEGLIITHCHEDHKRWFTDLALFNKYAPDFGRRVLLLTAESVHDEIRGSAGAALDRSLSQDSSTVLDIPYSDYVEYRRLGPRARFRIASSDEGDGRTRLGVVDERGDPVGPERAKVVLSEKTGRARLLFRDPDADEWVEPESYYPLSSRTFYQPGDDDFEWRDGITFSAVKAPVWHGLPAIGVKVATPTETLIFSSDTVHDVLLWERLWRQKREQRLGMPRGEFESACVLRGDINDYIERTWSEQRYREALHAFDGAVVLHDVSTRAGSVHTDYRILTHSVLDWRRTMLTHAPDRLTSEWALCHAGKRFRVRGGRLLEEVAGELLPLDADIYHRDGGRFYVGYRNPQGRHTVYNNNGLLNLSIDQTTERGEPAFRVDLYVDIGGRYYDLPEDDDHAHVVDPAGRVLLVRFFAGGCAGRPAVDRRKELLGARAPRPGG